MLTIKRFLTYFLFFTLYTISAQNSKKTYTAEEIIAYYDKIEMSDTESSNVEVIKKMINQSKKINDVSATIRGLIILQRVAFLENDYILSGRYSEEAEVLAKQMKDDYSLSLTISIRGTINAILAKYPEAEADLDKAIEYAEKIPNRADKHIQLSRVYACFAGIDEGLGNSKGILENTKKSLYFIETTPTLHLSSYQKSKYYYFYFIGLINMSAAYLHAQTPPNVKLAEPYIKKALSFKNTVPEYFKIYKTDVYFSTSDFYLKKGDYQQSIDYAMKLLHDKEINKTPRNRMLAYKAIKDAYGGAKDTKNENIYLKLYTNLNDSINTIEKQTIVQQSRDQINKSVKENNISKQRILLIVSVIILLIIIATWVYIAKKNKDYHHKYEALIVRIKNEQTENIKPVKFSSVNITDKTTKILLHRLEKFERSERYLQQEVSLTFLSNYLQTNTKYLSELIKIYRNKNFTDYINGLRIDYIVHKLYHEQKYRQYKISSLAEECGFSSSKVFLNAFRKINDVTPSYFIEQLKQDDKK